MNTLSLPADGSHFREWSFALMVGTVWASSLLFGLYILLFFGGSLLHNKPHLWNSYLPDLFDSDNLFSTFSIGIHFLTGGIILILGPIQLLSTIRQHTPKLHRWIGRLYVSMTLITGIGGLLFIALKGTTGGTVMNAGFALYGLLMALASFQTFRHARARRIPVHNLWAMRLFALALGSWLYRMEYGVWLFVFGDLWHTEAFNGPFDKVMAFFFYLPNLAVVEIIHRTNHGLPSPTVQWCAGLVHTLITCLVLFGTFEIFIRFWLPGISSALS